MNPYLQVENLTKSFGDRNLFSDISFGIAEGQRVALVARNGCGKTTLLNILTGHEQPDSGSITFRNDLRVGYLSQKPVFPAEMTVLEALMMHHREDDYEYETRYKQILGKLQITRTDQTIGTLSGGQLKRVALAQVLIDQPELLILDEPTNHLDLGMVEWLEDYLSRASMALLLVTHDRYFLDHVCTDILEISEQQLFAYHGNYSYYLEKRIERINAFNAETEKLKNIYRYELDWMRRMPQARGHKSKGRIDNFYKLDERVHQTIGDNSIHLENRSVYIGSKIFEAKHVCKRYPKLTILDDFNYVFARYEKMGIIGNNGTGKTTFLRMLLGEEPLDSGVFDIGETVRFGYYSQQGLSVPAGKKVLEVVTDEAEFIDLGDRKLSASQFLQHFLFSPSQQHDYVDKLSGGERQRLNLCRVLMRNPNFLILDEPTNDLDIQTMNILEDYLQGFKGCIIVVSHDRYFMDKVVDHLLVFHGEGKTQDFPGNYTQYRSLSPTQGGTLSPKGERENTPQTTKVKTEQKRKLSFKEQQELKALEVEIPQLEAEKAELETALSGGLSDMAEIAKASQRYEEVKNLLDEKEMRWLELSEI